MNNQFDNPIRKTNRLALVSLVAGIFSSLPYLPAFIALYILNCPFTLEKNTLCGRIELVSVAIPLSFYAFGGILLGIISLIVGGKGLEQIQRDGNVEKDHRIAVIGRIFGILGMVSNVLVGLRFFLSL